MDSRRESKIYEYIGSGSLYSDASFEFARGSELQRRNGKYYSPQERPLSALRETGADGPRDARIYSLSWDEGTLLARLSHSDLMQLSQQLDTNALPRDALFWFRASQTGEEIAITGADLIQLAKGEYGSLKQPDYEYLTVRLNPSTVPDRPPIPSFASSNGTTYYDVRRNTVPVTEDTQIYDAPPVDTLLDVDMLQGRSAQPNLFQQSRPEVKSPSALDESNGNKQSGGASNLALSSLLAFYNRHKRLVAFVTGMIAFSVILAIVLIVIFAC